MLYFDAIKCKSKSIPLQVVRVLKNNRRLSRAAALNKTKKEPNIYFSLFCSFPDLFCSFPDLFLDFTFFSHTTLDKPWYVLPLSPENDCRLQPEDLDTFLRSLPQKQHLLILNNPNNPTGHLYTQKELEALIQVCRRHGTLVLADEIYALTTYSIKEFTSIGSLYPEGTFVTGGLSKDRSAGGYRLGVCILPSTGGNALTQAFEKMAATLYTSIPTPIQRAAVSVYSESEEMEAYFQITREIHRIMGRIISTSCNKIPGLKATLPQGGFYFFLDFQALAEGFRQKGLKTSNQLGLELLDHPHKKV